MQRRLKSDGLRLTLLTATVLFFTLLVQPAPPPEALKLIGYFQITPLNAQASDRYYTLAVEALEERKISLNKAYVSAAIFFDPEAYSIRYHEYQRARDEVLNVQP